ncbi:hypothetical protein HanRHA438_Chr02g0053841 [Helianthus annuus]|nr:hypothetical protein HanRHA438_Chr02g0053841 [Helianthus annuus]
MFSYVREPFVYTIKKQTNINEHKRVHFLNERTQTRKLHSYTTVRMIVCSVKVKRASTNMPRSCSFGSFRSLT